MHQQKKTPFRQKPIDRCELTWLEYQRSSYLNIPAITRRFYPLRRFYERADDESGGLADGGEGSELNPHGSWFCSVGEVLLDGRRCPPGENKKE